MFQFCFNDCLPKNETNDGLVSHLSVTLEHYNRIKIKFSTAVDGIITDRYPSEVILNDSQFSLANCIQYLSRELKIIALINFNKYPVDNYFTLIDVDALLQKEYSMIINKVQLDALNVKIVQENDGILFTLPVHADLEQNRLVVVDKEANGYQVLNQYGDDDNTIYISEYISADLIRRSEGFEKFLAVIGHCSYNIRFKRTFENLTFDTQRILINELEYAIKRHEKTRFYPDDRLIKDVTPKDEKEIKVFELRIFSPVAVRMYFYELPDKVYLGSICGKPKLKKQDSDILNAASVIKELMVIEG